MGHCVEFGVVGGIERFGSGVGGGVVCVEMSGTEWVVLLRGVRLGGVCLGERGRVSGSEVSMVRMAVRVGVSCSMCRVGVVLVCAGVVSGCNAAFCSMP